MKMTRRGHHISDKDHQISDKKTSERATNLANEPPKVYDGEDANDVEPFTLPTWYIGPGLYYIYNSVAKGSVNKRQTGTRL
jgi:hypothetical protein